MPKVHLLSRTAIFCQFMHNFGLNISPYPNSTANDVQVPAAIIARPPREKRAVEVAEVVINCPTAAVPSREADFVLP